MNLSSYALEQALDTSNTTLDAFRLLSDANILSAPVMDILGGYRGFVDMLMLVCHLANQFEGALLNNIDENRWKSLVGSAKYRQLKERWSTTLVSDLRDYHRAETLSKDNSILVAVEKMVRSRSLGAHRLAIVDRFNGVLGLVTQSDLIEFLHNHLHLMPSGAVTPVTEIRPYSVLVTVTEDVPAIAAFQIMSKKQINGLAVVDDATGKLVDCLSSRDLRGIGPGMMKFRFLFDSVGAFKRSVRLRFPDLEKKWGGFVTRDASLEDVINKMYHKKIHRVFVVDSPLNMVPVDVITQTDVIKFISKECS